MRKASEIFGDCKIDDKTKKTIHIEKFREINQSYERLIAKHK